MKVTFPHLGKVYIAGKAFLEAIGCDYIIPPPISKKTIELGVKNSPEFVCYPYKLTLGCMLEALDLGADTILMVGGKRGICRLSYYSTLQEATLRDMGYKFKMITLNQDNWRECIFKELRLSTPRDYYSKLFRALLLARQKLKLIEEIEVLQRNTRCYEAHQGETTKVAEKSYKLLEGAKTLKEVKEARHKIHQLFNNIEKDYSIEPLKIGIVGEIYTVLEPMANHHLEEKLGNLGVKITQEMSIYRWCKVLLHLDFRRWYIKRFIARKYIKITSGAEDQQTLGKTELYAKRNYDGVILVYPFTCMPENNARAILPYISKRFNIPVLNLAFDEHTSETGLITRLEAFVDMLRRRKCT